MEDWTRLQHQLCEAELDRSALISCFDHLKEKFKADHYTVVIAHPQNTTDSQVWTSTYSEQQLNTYFNYIDDDEYLNSYLAHSLVGKAAIVDELLDVSHIKNEVFNEMLVKEYGARYALCTIIPVSQEMSFIITLHRQPNQRAFTEHERRLLDVYSQSLTPWAIQYKSLEKITRRQQSLTTLSAQDNRARAIITQDCEIISANNSWYEQIRLCPHIHTQDNIITLMGSEQFEFDSGLKQQSSGRLIVPAHQAKLILEWKKIDQQFELELINTEQELKLSFDRFQLLFSLSEAEKEVLFLLSKGMTGTEIADCRNVSKETIRSQIKSLLLKTGSHSQNELITMLFHICA